MLSHLLVSYSQILNFLSTDKGVWLASLSAFVFQELVFCKKRMNSQFFIRRKPSFFNSHSTFFPTNFCSLIKLSR